MHNEDFDILFRSVNKSAKLQIWKINKIFKKNFMLSVQHELGVRIFIKVYLVQNLSLVLANLLIIGIKVWV